MACRDFEGQARPFYLGRNEGGVLQDDLQAFPTMPSGTACRTAAPADYDRDGDVDLLFCGDTLTLLENQGGNFVDVTSARGLRQQVLDAATATCGAVSWVDVDHDGDLDVSVTPYTNFVTGERALVNSGVLIFENQLQDGQPGFQLAARLDAPSAEAQLCELGAVYLAPGASLLGGGRSGVWLDFDLDGDQDLLALMPSVYCLARPWLYTSLFAQGEPRFSVSSLGPGQVLSHVTGSIAADLDEDGDLDVVSHQWGGAGGRGLFRNNLVENLSVAPRHLVVSGVSDPGGDATDTDTSDDRTQPGLTFEIDLDGPDEQPDFALGSGKLLVQATGASSQASSPGPKATFGLGQHEGPVWVRTFFPDGSEVRLRMGPDASEAILRDCPNTDCF